MPATRCQCRMVHPALLSLCAEHSAQMTMELDREPRVIPALRELLNGERIADMSNDERSTCRWCGETLHGTADPVPAIGTTPNGVPICANGAALSGLRVTPYET